MHAGKHRIGCCPSRQPLRTRCLCKYIRWVHLQQSDTKEARSCCNPALWRWLCSPSCLPSLRIEYLNRLMLRTQTKKVDLPRGRGSIIHDYFFGLAATYVLPYMQRIHTWLFNQQFRERKEREREKRRTKKSTPQMGLFGQIWRYLSYLFIGSYPQLVFGRLWEAYKIAKSEKWPMLCVLTQMLD